MIKFRHLAIAAVATLGWSGSVFAQAGVPTPGTVNGATAAANYREETASFNGVIGKDNGLPWHIPGDLKRFKRLTMGTAMIMGRKTFDSLPGLLPGRRHIVLTRDRGWSAEGAELAHDVAGALARD